MRVENKNRKGVLRYLWYPLLAVNFLTILFLLLSVISWYVSPAKITIIAYLGMAFPFIYVINIAFLFFWTICFQWRYALISFISLIICISPALTYFPIHFKTKEIPENCIKVMSYNVRAFNWNKKLAAADNPILTYIRDCDPDIVCIQEYTAVTDKMKRNTNDIKKVLSKYPYFSFINLWPSRPTVDHGLACFSKYPILSATKIPVESSGTNGSVLYKIKVNNKIISVINNHLESNQLTSADKQLYRDLLKDTNRQNIDNVAHNIKNKLGSAFQKRAPQANLISKWIKEQDTDGVIVCGDFNDTPISYTYKTIKGDLIDSYANTGFGPGITYHENHFWFRIDFIMHSRNIKSYNTTVGKVKYSDHYPVWTYLQID